MTHVALFHEGAWYVAYKQAGVDVYVAVCDCLCAASAEREARRLNVLYLPPQPPSIVRAKRPPAVRDNLQPQLF